MSNDREDILRSRLDLEPWDSELLYISKSRYDGDWNSIQHSHPFAEIFFVIDGKGQFLVESQTLLVQKGDFILVNPNVPHTETSFRDMPMEYFVLGINHFTFQAEHEEESRYYFIPSYMKHVQTINVFLQYLFREMKIQDEYSAQICQKILEAIILEVMRHKRVNLIAQEEVKQVREVALARRYIDQNYSQEITLDTLSQITQTSKYYLAHVFKETFGISPIRYLNQRRIDIAKAMLRTTDLQVSQIANSVGFSSASYFTQAFNRETGYSPKAFRDLNAPSS